MQDHPGSAPGSGSGALLALLDRGLGAVTFAAAALGAVLLLVMTAVVGYSVALRYLFNRPQVWTDEFVAAIEARGRFTQHVEVGAISPEAAAELVRPHDVVLAFQTFFLEKTAGNAADKRAVEGRVA